MDGGAALMWYCVNCLLIAANHSLKSALTTQTGLQQLNLQLVKFKLELGSHLSWDHLRVGESFISTLTRRKLNLHFYIWFSTYTAAKFFVSNGRKLTWSRSCWRFRSFALKVSLDWLELICCEKWGSLCELEWPFGVETVFL